MTLEICSIELQNSIIKSEEKKNATESLAQGLHFEFENMPKLIHPIGYGSDSIHLTTFSLYFLISLSYQLEATTQRKR